MLIMCSMWILLLLVSTITLAVEPFHDDRREPGILESPNYPRPYPPESESSWSFERDTGVWAVVFEDMDIEQTKGCKDDYLLIKDASNRKNLIRTCGSMQPEPVISEGRRILISFHSDHMNQGKGFRLRILHSETKDALKRRLSIGSTTTAKVQEEVKKASLSQDDIMILSLSLALLVAVLVLVCLTVWIIYYHCARTKRTCCGCGCGAGGKDVILTMSPTQQLQGTRYTKPRLKRKDGKPQPVEANGSPNVYLPMPDHEINDQSQCSTPIRRTDSHGGRGLPMYYTSGEGRFEEPKFIGVM